MTLQLGNSKALDLEGAVNNFLGAFYGAKNNKAQDKYKKLQPQIDLVNHIVGDPDMPLNSKIKAIDTVPYILGAPPEDGISLSRHMGLDKLAQEDVVTKDSKYKSGSAQAVDYSNLDTTQQAKVGEDPDKASFGAASQQFNEDSTRLLKKRGDLSANEYKELSQLKLLKTKEDSEFERQYKIALVNSRLQEAVLNKQGWEKNGDWFLNQDNNTWNQVWFNPRTHETQTQSLAPNVVPMQILQTQIKSSGPTAALKSLIPGIAASLNLPEDHPNVIAMASKTLYDLTRARADYYESGTKGTRPSDTRAEEGLSIRKSEANRQATKDIAAAQGDYTTADAESKTAKANADNYETSVVKPLEQQMKNWIDPNKEDGDASDPEYQKLQTQYKAAQNQLSHLRNVQGIQEGKAQGHKKRLDTLNGDNGSSKKIVNWSKSRLQSYADRYFGGDTNKAIKHNSDAGIEIRVN